MKKKTLAIEQNCFKNLILGTIERRERKKQARCMKKKNEQCHFQSNYICIGTIYRKLQFL